LKPTMTGRSRLIEPWPCSMNITGPEAALLLNFRETKLDWKRVVAGPAHQ
jgi:hypothetical protein